MKTTTLRVLKTTQARLKKTSTAEHISIMELVDKLVDEHERCFWKGFEEESISFLDKEEIKTRKVFENTLGDGIGIQKNPFQKGEKSGSLISAHLSVQKYKTCTLPLLFPVMNSTRVHGD